ncbi:lipopolysaccharide biosynthesis protein [Vagococcus fluvialis]|uniref:lipopolysaccharide biosynthesis protein n=1 Tax=Vagococcus fluvialis TaxID=2738 RepID=UPI003B5CD84B
MSNYKKLVSNSIIFAIGNLGSKLIIIFLVPFYTYYLTTQEFGIVDLATNTINMLLPIISLSIFDSVLRFSMDNNEDRREVLTNGVVITTLGAIISIILFLLFITKNSIFYYMIIILILQSYQSLFSQYIRAIGQVKVFAVNGILTAVALSLANIIFISFYKLGIDGYLLSMVISTLISCIYLIIRSSLAKDFSLACFNKNLVKQMILYSLPLIPNSFMWWIINASNRYFIVYFISLEDNGLFSVASKIPSVLAIFQMIFFQAWQLSAIDEFGSKSQNSFFSKVFEIFSSFMIIITSFIFIFLNPIVKILLSSSYFDSWKFVPFLLMGTLFSSFSSFFGTNYIAAKKTKGALLSSIVGSITNIFLCLLLIPIIGTNGAGIATMFSFLFMWLYRVLDTKNMVEISLNKRKLILQITLLFAQILMLYKGFIILNVIIFLLLLITNISIVKIIIKKFLNKIKK